jgi:two-component system, OmpR family, KDP operon response regulator KdpE
MQANVLIVNDEDASRRTIRAALAASGFGVEEARNGEEALEAIHRHRCNLMLLDTNGPGATGIETCRQIRLLAPCTGIIMLSARGDEDDQVRALEAGADDYMTKPFQLGELKARLAAVLRRVAAQEESGILRAGELKLDLDRRTLSKAGEKICLSRKEFDLLSFLMKSQGVPFTTATLLRCVWGPDCGNGIERLRTYVRRIRKKIEDDPTIPQYLLTEPLVGYRFRNPNPPSGSSGRPQPSFGQVSDQVKLDALPIDQLREAIRGNRVSFPSQVPTFERHERPDLQWKLAQLYFVLGWTCERVASRYGVLESRIRQILTIWKRRAVEVGYIQYIPPAALPLRPQVPAGHFLRLHDVQHR